MPTRYRMTDRGVQPWDYGEWVHYDSYLALQNRHKKLKGLLTDLMSSMDNDRMRIRMLLDSEAREGAKVDD